MRWRSTEILWISLVASDSDFSWSERDAYWNKQRLNLGGNCLWRPFLQKIWWRLWLITWNTLTVWAANSSNVSFTVRGLPTIRRPYPNTTFTLEGVRTCPLWRIWLRVWPKSAKCWTWSATCNKILPAVLTQRHWTKSWTSQKCGVQFFVTIFKIMLDKRRKTCGLFANYD